MLEPKRLQYSIYNSGTPNEESYMKQLNTWIAKTISEEYLGEKQPSKWKMRKTNSVTQDETACGLYVCAHAQVISEFPTPPEDMWATIPTGHNAGLVLRRYFLGMIFRHGQRCGPWAGEKACMK